MIPYNLEAEANVVLYRQRLLQRQSRRWCTACVVSRTTPAGPSSSAKSARNGSILNVWAPRCRSAHFPAMQKTGQADCMQLSEGSAFFLHSPSLLTRASLGGNNTCSPGAMHAAPAKGQKSDDTAWLTTVGPHAEKS